MLVHQHDDLVSFHLKVHAVAEKSKNHRALDDALRNQLYHYYRLKLIDLFDCWMMEMKKKQMTMKMEEQTAAVDQLLEVKEAMELSA